MSLDKEDASTVILLYLPIIPAGIVSYVNLLQGHTICAVMLAICIVVTGIYGCMLYECFKHKD